MYSAGLKAAQMRKGRTFAGDLKRIRGLDAARKVARSVVREQGHAGQRLMRWRRAGKLRTRVDDPALAGSANIGEDQTRRKRLAHAAGGWAQQVRPMMRRDHDANHADCSADI